MGQISDAGVLVGGRILIKMDQKVVGFANEATCSDSYGLQPVHVLGQLQPIDYVPTDARHQIDMQMMIVRGGSLISANLEPAGAGNFGFITSDSIGHVGSLTTGVENLSGGLVTGSTDGTVIATEGDKAATAGALRVLHSKVFDIEIFAPKQGADGGPGTVVRYKNCFFNSGSVRFNANQITVHSCTFFALDKEGAFVADSLTTAPGAFIPS